MPRSSKATGATFATAASAAARRRCSAADALILGARWDEAQLQLDEAFTLAARLGEPLFVPELRLLAARIALGRGEPAAARASLRDALQGARAQQAAWVELGALVALCELEDAVPGDPDALAKVRRRVSVAATVPLVAKADELLRAKER